MRALQQVRDGLRFRFAIVMIINFRLQACQLELERDREEGRQVSLFSALLCLTHLHLKAAKLKREKKRERERETCEGLLNHLLCELVDEMRASLLFFGLNLALALAAARFSSARSKQQVSASKRKL